MRGLATLSILPVWVGGIPLGRFCQSKFWGCSNSLFYYLATCPISICLGEGVQTCYFTMCLHGSLRWENESHFQPGIHPSTDARTFSCRCSPPRLGTGVKTWRLCPVWRAGRRCSMLLVASELWDAWHTSVKTENAYEEITKRCFYFILYYRQWNLSRKARGVQSCVLK